MATNKVTIETPVGVFTRRTARPYTYAIIAVGKSEAYLYQRHADHVKWNRKESAGYQAIVDNPVYTDAHRAKYQEYIDSLDRQLAVMGVQFEAVLASNSAAKCEDRGTCLSWHMSLAQAEKTAQTWRNEGWQRVQIVPVGGAR